MEQVNLATQVTRPNTTKYTISELILDWDNSVIVIQIKSDTGDILVKTYTDTVARNLLVALNKVNLATRSLNQRVLDRLIADGFITGSVAGTVE